MAVKTAFHASRESFSTITTFFETINFFLSFWNSELKKFRSLAFCFRRRCQKCNSRVQKTLRGKIIEVNLLKWEHFWPFFEVWTEKNFDGSKRHNNRSVETAFPVSKGTFWRKQFFWKNYKFDEKACTLSKKNRISEARLKQSCQNISFFMSRKTVKKNLFAGKGCIFLHFLRPLSARKDWLLPWIVGMSAWAEISQSAGKNWPKSYFFEKKTKFLFINVDLQIEIFIFWLSNFCSLVKSPSHVFIETCFLKLKFFVKNSKSFFYIFSFDWSNSEFPELLLKVFQNFFCVSILTIRAYFVSIKNVLHFSDDFGTWETRLWTFVILAKK